MSNPSVEERVDSCHANIDAFNEFRKKNKNKISLASGIQN